MLFGNLKRNFFYLKTANGEKALIYKSDKEKAQEALKNEKYTLKFSLYSMLDEKRTENDVYLLGVNNKKMFMMKISGSAQKIHLNKIRALLKTNRRNRITIWK